MENKRTENRNQASVTVSKDEVIAKLKDDGDFDRLRLKIIRKLKDDVSPPFLTFLISSYNLLGFQSWYHK